MLKTVSAITNAIGALNYKGTWNANTNTPALASGVGTKGDYYVVSVAGNTALDGISNWGVGDWAVFNGSVWQRVEGGADLNGVNLTVSGTSTLGTANATSLEVSSNATDFSRIDVTNTSTNGRSYRLASSGVNGYFDFPAGAFGLRDLTDGATRFYFNTAGDFILIGATAQKASGTTWTNPSDKRLKENVRDYTKGINELMQVRVCEWEYNGKGGTTKGMKGLGVIADEVMTVLPNTVENYSAKLNENDKEFTELKKFDATEITWLLVKTVQELKAKIDSIEAELQLIKK
jgi:hypothetical protein